MPDNLEQVKKLDNFVCDILKGKHKQKDLDMDSTFEKLQSKDACVMGPLSKLWVLVEETRRSKKGRYPLIWTLLEHILNKHCFCWGRPAITSHIFSYLRF